MTIDAQVVGLAEERAAYNAVTIVTSDLDDICLLVEISGVSNISVRSV